MYVFVICYDEVYKFSVVWCDLVVVMLFLDIDVLLFSGVYFEGWCCYKLIVIMGIVNMY